jgi:predicted oxidoreductase
MMNRARLQENGPEVSRIAAGLWRLSDWNLSTSGLCEWIEGAVELGLTTFDHADIYGDYTCEKIFGEALAAMPSIRQNIQLVTKCGIQLVSENNPGVTVKHYDTSREHILKSVENSMERLRTDYLDLLLIHRPDPLMNASEIAEAFTELRESGKVRFFGVSNFNTSQFEMLQSRLSFPLVTNQIEISVLHTEPFDDGILDTCAGRGISPMAWSPLGGGELFDSDSGQAVRVRAELESICGRLGIGSIDILALAWLLRHPAGIVPVIGTHSLERMKRAVEATGIELPREDWFRILRASKGTDVP